MRCGSGAYQGLAAQAPQQRLPQRAWIRGPFSRYICFSTSNTPDGPSLTGAAGNCPQLSSTPLHFVSCPVKLVLLLALTRHIQQIPTCLRFAQVRGNPRWPGISSFPYELSYVPCET